MSVPVDVLYVLDRVCALPFASHGIAELDDTRAAVAELIAEAEKSLTWLSSYPGGGALPAYERLRAAIAKVQS